ncbi:MAG: hypothetical protein RLZ35_5 [Pseudomonadota bacterium]|jgi:colicin import membrane protein
MGKKGIATEDYTDYFISAMQSMLAHAVVFTFLLVTTDMLSGARPAQVKNASSEVKIVQAVTIDEAAVVEEVQRLETVELQHQKTIRDAKLAQEALQQLKQKQEKFAQEEKRKLTALKVQAEKEKEALQALQQKKALQEKELKALSEKKLQEQQRLKKLEEQKIAIEKKRLEAQQLAEKKAAEQKAAEQEKATQMAKAAKAAKEQQAILAAKKQLIDDHRQKYQALMREKVNQVWILPGEDTQGLVCELEIKLLPDGTVLSSKVVRSSGNFAFDRSAEAAVSRASPLPIPEDKELMPEFRNFIFTFDPSAT